MIALVRSGTDVLKDQPILPITSFNIEKLHLFRIVMIHHRSRLKEVWHERLKLIRIPSIFGVVIC